MDLELTEKKSAIDEYFKLKQKLYLTEEERNNLKKIFKKAGINFFRLNY